MAVHSDVRAYFRKDPPVLVILGFSRRPLGDTKILKELVPPVHSGRAAGRRLAGLRNLTGWSARGVGDLLFQNFRVTQGPAKKF